MFKKNAEDQTIPALFLDSLINDSNKLMKVNEQINEIVSLLINGYTKDSIIKLLGIRSASADYIIELATARVKVKDKFSLSDHIFLDLYSASYSTPEIVGKYRSERLNHKKILDAGCGAGMQSIFLGLNSHVVGIDMDKSRISMAKLNNIAYGTDVKFRRGDINEMNIKNEHFDVLFSDPLRPQKSTERNLEELSPNPVTLMEKFQNNVKTFVFDLPPFLSKSKIQHLSGTLEYLSYGGNLSRLTLYGDNGNKLTYEATMLEPFLNFSSDHIEKGVKQKDIGDFIFIPDSSLFYSELHGNYCNKVGLNLLISEKRKAIYTGSKQIESFMGECYRTVEQCQYDQLHSVLRKHNFGKVILRYECKNYYVEKNELESKLDGNRSAYIFKNGESYILGELIRK
jgi:SAM-dependent methyltransferase